MTDTTTVTPTPTAPVEGDEAARAAAAAAAAEAAKATTPTEPEPIVDLEAEEDKKGTFTYEDTGDKGLNTVLTFLGKHGFGPGHPAMVDAVNGDFGLLKAQLAEKNVPGSEAYLQLAQAAYDRMHAVHEKQRADDKAAVHTIAGGEEQWNAVAEWAGKNTDEAEKPVIQAMLAKGGVEAKLAATLLTSLYTRANGDLPVKETDGAGPAAATTSGAAANTTNALSPKEYGQAVAAARRTHSNRDGAFEQSDAYRKLVQRRAAWRE